MAVPVVKVLTIAVLTSAAVPERHESPGCPPGKYTTPAEKTGFCQVSPPEGYYFSIHNGNFQPCLDCWAHHREVVNPCTTYSSTECGACHHGYTEQYNNIFGHDECVPVFHNSDEQAPYVHTDIDPLNDHTPDQLGITSKSPLMHESINTVCPPCSEGLLDPSTLVYVLIACIILTLIALICLIGYCLHQRKIIQLLQDIRGNVTIDETASIPLQSGPSGLRRNESSGYHTSSETLGISLQLPLDPRPRSASTGSEFTVQNPQPHERVYSV